MAAAAGFDWNGLLSAGLNAFLGANTASNNKSTATNYGNQTQFNPFNINTPSSSVLFNGNNALASLNPTYQGLQKQLTGNAGSLFGSALGGNPSFLQGEFNDYNSQMPGVSNVNPGSQQNISTGIGDQFNNTSQGFLGSLGGFNPQDAASSYTNNLRAQAQPGNTQNAQGLAQDLFNSGRLGSSGGANLFGQLMQAQNQQDLGFQLAGQQYGGQEQSRLAGLAQQFGQLGTGINQSYAQSNNQFQNDYFNRNLASNQNTFNQGNQRAQQRFQNASNLFGAGLQNQQVQASTGLGMLQGAQGLDQNLLQAIGVGGNLGAAKSQLNQSAYNPQLQAGVAQNNTNGAGGSNVANQILNGLGGASNIASLLGSLFGGGGSYGDTNSINDALYGNGGDFSSWLDGIMSNDSGGVPQNWINDPNVGFNSAGGEAAIDPVQITQSKVGDGSTGATASGATPASGITDTSASGLLGTAGNVANIYSGIQQGDAGGYLKAANGAAGLAGYNIPAADYAGAVSQIAKGDTTKGLYNAAITYVGGPAAIGNAIANFVNAPGKKDNARISAVSDQMLKNGWKQVLVGKNAYQYQSPIDGRYYNINESTFLPFARAITSGGSEEEIAKTWQKFLDTGIKR